MNIETHTITILSSSSWLAGRTHVEIRKLETFNCHHLLLFQLFLSVYLNNLDDEGGWRRNKSHLLRHLLHTPSVWRSQSLILLDSAPQRCQHILLPNFFNSKSSSSSSSSPSLLSLSSASSTSSASSSWPLCWYVTERSSVSVTVMECDRTLGATTASSLSTHPKKYSWCISNLCICSNC